MDDAQEGLKTAFSVKGDVSPYPGICYIDYKPNLFDSAMFYDANGKDVALICDVSTLYPNQEQLADLSSMEQFMTFRGRLNGLIDPAAKARPHKIKVVWWCIKPRTKGMRFYFANGLCVAMVNDIPDDKSFLFGVDDIDEWPENIDKEWVLEHRHEIMFDDTTRPNCSLQCCVQ